MTIHNELVVTIRTDAAAFGEDDWTQAAATADLLEQVAAHIRDSGPIRQPYRKLLFDANGQRCGVAKHVRSRVANDQKLAR